MNAFAGRQSAVVQRRTEEISVWDRRRYFGSLWRNILANLLPALYIALSRLWLVELNPNYVALTGAYVYLGSIAQALNDGFPKVGWRLITDNTSPEPRKRYELAFTLIGFVSALATLLTIGCILAAPLLADSFVPGVVREASVKYIRLGVGANLFSIVINVISISTRALDEPDIPLGIQSAKFVVNIVLDLLLISRFRVAIAHPTLNTQATINLICNAVSCLLGLVWFLILARRKLGEALTVGSPLIYWYHLRTLLRIGWPFQAEAVPRLILGVWFGTMIFGLSAEFASAYGIFFTVRLAVLFAPLLAVESSCYTFVGHAWAKVTARQHHHRGSMTRSEMREISNIILTSIGLVAAVEIIIYVTFSLRPGRDWAMWLSNGQLDIANLEVDIWRKIDWGFMFLTLFLQMTSIILIAQPTWYLYQSLFSYVGFQLPVLVAARDKFDGETIPWTFFILALPAPFVVLFFTNCTLTTIWAYRMMEKKPATSSDCDAGSVATQQITCDGNGGITRESRTI